MRSLGSAAAKVAAPVPSRRGFGEAQMILAWASIVGDGLASDTAPVKLSFARAERIGARHPEPARLDRINTCFFYRTVGFGANHSLRQPFTAHAAGDPAARAAASASGRRAGRRRQHPHPFNAPSLPIHALIRAGKSFTAPHTESASPHV